MKGERGKESFERERGVAAFAATAFGTTNPTPRGQHNMPQIQYSEKYYDDVYEYRYARIRVRRFPARFGALFDLLHATNGVRAPTSRAVPPCSRRARRRYPARYRSRAGCSTRAICAFERVRIDRHASRRLRRRVSRAREPRDRGPCPPRTPSKSVRRSPHFPLYLHRQTRRASPRHRQAPAQGSLALRSTFPSCDTARRRRLDRTPAIPKLGVETASLPLGTRSPSACAGVPRHRSSPPARAKRTAELTRASFFPPLSHRRSGAVSACSSPAGGCTTPSTGPSPTSCCTGASPVPLPRALFSKRLCRGLRPILPPHQAVMWRSTRVGVRR